MGRFQLSAHRVWLDQKIVEWSRSIAESDPDHTLNYTSMKGVPADRSFYGLVMSISSTIRRIGETAQPSGLVVDPE
ncbi:hypothetical protein [Pseudomonas sp. TH39(2020)]|uniref:hypothetical protein n=1 Tax=Pseudomonas sp. TH39(2020) TaxID=2796349 RepID=UPI001F5B9CCF|nr:hypothetical protein [Pseudomonas sp. TH39(2020)]